MNSANHRRPLAAALESLGPHDHLCSIYETQQEQFDIAVPFIRIGIERGEKCLYIADENGLDDVRRAMQAGGIDVDGAVKSGALVLTTKSQAYLRRGSFDPDWMFTFWQEAAEGAQAEGFSALRATGETEWVLRGAPGLERWMEYESRLTQALANSNALALCQYNRTKFAPEIILDVIRTHPLVIYRDTVCRNFYFVPPEEFLGPGQAGREVQRLLNNIRDRERMDAALHDQQEELKLAREELEKRISERTAELVEANRALQGNEALLRLAQKAAGLGIADWDIPAGIATWSEELCDLYGVALPERVMTYAGWLELIHPEDRNRVDQECQACLAETKPWDSEFRVVWPDGTIHWLSAKAAVFHCERGEPVRLLATNMDITARKEAEQAQLSAQKLESIGLLAGGVAHDFNNLLTGILGYASLLTEEVDDPAREYLNAIMRSAERGADLTRQLLAYAGKGRFFEADLDLSQVVRDTAQLLLLSIPKTVKLDFNLAAGIRPVRADMGQMQQVVMNLVVNAAEAIGNQPDGAIVVTTRSEWLDRRGDGRPEPGWYSVLEVSDNGSGMDEATKARIFDPFFTTKFFGRGLGLAAVAGVVRSLGGAIEVDTAPGEGSTFRLFLPSREPQRPKILVVDDEDTVREFMRAVFARQGYEVLEAESGEQALQFLDGHMEELSAVLLDVVMPGLSGADVLKAIKSKRPQLRVLVTSGFNRTEAERLCGAGSLADAFIQKPYAAGELAAKMNLLLGRMN